MENQTKQNLSNPDLWIRLVYMLLFTALLCIAKLVITTVAVLQFLLVLLSGSDNRNLKELGQITSKWSLQAFYFLTFNTEQKPFPFDDWPELDEEEPETLLEDTDTSEDENAGEEESSDTPDNNTDKP